MCTCSYTRGLQSTCGQTVSRCKEPQQAAPLPSTPPLNPSPPLTPPLPLVPHLQKPPQCTGGPCTPQTAGSLGPAPAQLVGRCQSPQEHLHERKVSSTHHVTTKCEVSTSIAISASLLLCCQLLAAGVTTIHPCCRVATLLCVPVVVGFPGCRPLFSPLPTGASAEPSTLLPAQNPQHPHNAIPVGRFSDVTKPRLAV